MASVAKPGLRSVMAGPFGGWREARCDRRARGPPAMPGLRSARAEFDRPFFLRRLALRHHRLLWGIRRQIGRQDRVAGGRQQILVLHQAREHAITVWNEGLA